MPMQFWSQPETLRYMDENSVKLALALATDGLLLGDENIPLVRSFCQLALEVEMRIGGPAKSHLLKQFHKSRTDRGLKLLLAKQIPCRCLDETKAAAKPEARTCICLFCGNERSRAEIFQCTRCNLVEYCSKDCQRKDWKDHRSLCDYCSEYL